MEDVQFNITANGNQAKAALDGVHSKVNNLSRGFNSLGSTLKASIGTYLSAATFKALAASAAAFADEIKNASDRLEMTTTNVQKLRAAGRHAGVSLGEIESALQKMDDYLGDAANGDSNKMSLLNKLGLSEDDVRHLGKYESLMKIMAGADKTSNPVGIYRDIFGQKGGAKVMSMGSELKTDEFKNILDEQTINQMDALGDAFEDLTVLLTTYFTPALVNVVDWINSKLNGYRNRKTTFDEWDGKMSEAYRAKHGKDVDAGKKWDAEYAYWVQRDFTKRPVQDINKEYATNLYGEDVYNQVNSVSPMKKPETAAELLGRLRSEREAKAQTRASFLMMDRKGLGGVDAVNRNGSITPIPPAQSETDSLVSMGNLIGKDAGFRLERLNVEANKHLEKLVNNSNELNKMLKKPERAAQEYAP